MRYITVLVIVFLLVFAVSAQEEEPACTLTFNSNTGVFEAENCEGIDLQEFAVDYGQITVEYESQGIVQPDNEEDEEVEETNRRFEIGDLIEVSLDSSAVSCRQTSTPDSEQITVFYDDQVLTIVDGEMVEGRMRWLVTDESTECWINEGNVLGNPVYLIDEGFHDTYENTGVLVEFEAGDRLIVQGVGTLHPCVSETETIELYQDTWGTVISVDGTAVEIHIGYTDTVCIVQNELTSEGLPILNILN